MSESLPSRQPSHRSPFPAALPAGEPLAPPIPVPLASLIGREREQAAVRALLLQSHVRLLTITGPGGVGKTRLALAVASTLESNFGDGVAFVSLVAIRDPKVVLPTIAGMLGIRESGDQPLAQRLHAFLRSREMLLVLDNFEQVLAAAPAIAEVLVVCPRLKMLITCRASLRVSGERAYPLSPLGLPKRGDLSGSAATGRDSSIDQVAAAEAVRLFVERTRAVRPDFRLQLANAAAVAEICVRLDGLPLAIELAAARVAHLTPAALLARLEPRLPLLTGGARDHPERLQTMRAAIAWSHDLLTAQEQLLFHRLSVFVGGFTLDAAEAVVNGPSPFGITLLDGIASLVDQSMLRPKEPTSEAENVDPRYAMLETVREYGLERLATSGEEPFIRAAHASWCLGLVERAEPALAGPEQVRWLSRLEAEQPNLRTALAWSFASATPESGRRMAAALGWFWWARGDPSEGRIWLERALAQNTDTSARTRARLQTQLAEILWSLGDYVTAEALNEDALAAWRALGDEAGAAACLLNLGRVAQDAGDYSRAAGLYDESLAMHRALGDDANTIRCLCNLGMAVLFHGDLDRAAELQEEALHLADRSALPIHVAKASYNLGEIERRRGNLAQAIALFRESLVRHSGLGERRFVAEALRGLARVAAALDQVEDAALFAGADEIVRAAIGAPITPEPERLTYERTVADVRQHLGEARFADMLAAGRGTSPDAASAHATEVAARLEHRAAAGSPSPAASLGGLTTRELDVIRLLVAGKSDREIGAALFISHRTVNGHVAQIFTKLGVHSRAEVGAEAVRRGLVSARSSGCG